MTRLPRWLRLTLVEVLAVGCPMAVVLMSHPTWWPLATPVALIACALLPVRLAWPWLAMLACGPALVGGLGWAPVLVAMFRLGRCSTRVRYVVPWVVFAVLCSYLPVQLKESLPVPDAILSIAFVTLTAGAPAALGALLRVRRELTESLTELRKARESEMEARLDNARAQERARIAREIHDAVGHHATLIAVQSAALAATTTDPRARAIAKRLRELAKESLAEMRAALGLLNADRTPRGLIDLPELIDRARDAGLSVTLEDGTNGEEPLPPVARAAYRVVQEALTNAARHAPGAEVSVQVNRERAKIVVTVSNGPSVIPEPVDRNGGTGLEGLAERVHSAGGILQSGRAADGGFVLRAELPANPTKVGKEQSTIGGGGDSVAAS
ncbi:sensor histidine kinase [Labedaea rhizosphaerae]|uniref:histidine kinase n=1 Tax=Labedaea rhizosphaerae TaxID=598644 RepID=A0A4R6RW08_LABRH|nr:histidine kinase [Labedaea rhizosphaerae]TDP90505.1 signal transduction histidine kinase [Labedaea rhizosphaerae]